MVLPTSPAKLKHQNGNKARRRYEHTKSMPDRTTQYQHNFEDVTTDPARPKHRRSRSQNDQHLREPQSATRQTSSQSPHYNSDTGVQSRDNRKSSHHPSDNDIIMQMEQDWASENGTNILEELDLEYSQQHLEFSQQAILNRSNTASKTLPIVTATILMKHQNDMFGDHGDSNGLNEIRDDEKESLKADHLKAGSNTITDIDPSNDRSVRSTAYGSDSVTYPPDHVMQQQISPIHSPPIMDHELDHRDHPTPITRTYDDDERKSIHIGNADKTANFLTRPATATNVRPRTGRSSRSQPQSFDIRTLHEDDPYDYMGNIGHYYYERAARDSPSSSPSLSDNHLIHQHQEAHYQRRRVSRRTKSDTSIYSKSSSRRFSDLQSSKRRQFYQQHHRTASPPVTNPLNTSPPVNTRNVRSTRNRPNGVDTLNLRSPGHEQRYRTLNEQNPFQDVNGITPIPPPSSSPETAPPPQINNYYIYNHNQYGPNVPNQRMRNQRNRRQQQNQLRAATSPPHSHQKRAIQLDGHKIGDTAHKGVHNTERDKSETYSQAQTTTNDEASILFPKQSIPFIDRNAFPRRPLTPKMQIRVEEHLIDAPYPFTTDSAIATRSNNGGTRRGVVSPPIPFQVYHPQSDQFVRSEDTQNRNEPALISPPVLSKSTKSVESEDRNSGGQSEPKPTQQPVGNGSNPVTNSLFSPLSATPEPVAAPMSPQSLSSTVPVRRLSETKKSPFHVQLPAISLQRITSSENEGKKEERRKRDRSSSRGRRNGKSKKERKERNPGISARRQQRPKSRERKTHRLETTFHEYSLDETDLFAKLAKIGSLQEDQR